MRVRYCTHRERCLKNYLKRGMDERKRQNQQKRQWKLVNGTLAANISFCCFFSVLCFSFFTEFRSICRRFAFCFNHSVSDGNVVVAIHIFVSSKFFIRLQFNIIFFLFSFWHCSAIEVVDQSTNISQSVTLLAILH